MFFSGHWCPPSREFTPKLVEAYNNVHNEVKQGFEIVFISWDRDQESFDHYYNEMPWKALPYTGKSRYIHKSIYEIWSLHFSEERSRQEALTNRFQVRGIPHLIILSPSGEIISHTGVQEIMANGIQYIRQWSTEGKYPVFFISVFEFFCSGQSLEWESVSTVRFGNVGAQKDSVIRSYVMSSISMP